MTRLISEQSAQAFFNHQNFKLNNTEVKDDKFYLFNNCIAKFENNELFVRFVYNSNTTRERLNTLGYIGGYKINATQKNFTPYLNGQKIDDELTWVKVQKI